MKIAEVEAGRIPIEEINNMFWNGMEWKKSIFNRGL